tara:strand:- start:2008 stop:2562 length:555 start_codon:yes stop_codon:yes gene_type:complete
MILSRRLMMSGGSSSTTYVWEFDTVEDNKGNLDWEPRAAVGGIEHVYNAGDTLPDMFTSTFTVPTGKQLKVIAARGFPTGTAPLNRGLVGIRFETSETRVDEAFYTTYPFKSGATIDVYNATEGSLMEGFSGTDSHVDAFLFVAGHYFYPDNQTRSDLSTNGMTDWNNTVGLSDGDVIELRITV